MPSGSSILHRDDIADPGRLPRHNIPDLDPARVARPDVCFQPGRPATLVATSPGRCNAAGTVLHYGAVFLEGMATDGHPARAIGR